MQKESNENWKDIPGYEGKYQVSDLGNVRSLNYLHTGKTKELKAGLNRGYLQLGLYNNEKRKLFRVHTLVFITFRGPIPPGMQVDHINNIKTDNRLENLQLLSGADNTRKACKGRTPWNKGKTHTPEQKAKLSAAAKACWERKRSGINNL